MDTQIAQKLRRARLEQHLSVRALSRRSGISIGTIHGIEKGDRKAYDHTVVKLADALGMDIDPLIEAPA